MTNQEINERVARKLGLNLSGFEADGYTVSGEEICPDYCTDILAAWEIVEFITPMSNEDHVSIRKTYDPKRRWCVRMHKQTAWADTAPRAICLAFLKLP